jgi:hypothetical protein
MEGRHRELIMEEIKRYFEKVHKLIEFLEQNNTEAQESIVSLMREIENLREERDYLRAIIDQPGGRG